MQPNLLTHDLTAAKYHDRLDVADRRRQLTVLNGDALARKGTPMSPHSATDLVRAIRHAHGIPENVPAASESPSRIPHWMTIIFKRARVRPM